MFANPVFITSGIITVEIYSQYARKKKTRFAWTGDRKESLGNDDRAYCSGPQVRVVRSYFDNLLRYAVISDILWNSCFESCGPKDTR